MDEHSFDHISRQLSELATVTNVAGATSGTSPDLGGQWTQFSGISTQTGQTPFRNLCSWNPMDLPDFNPLSQPLTAKVDSGSNRFIADPGDVFKSSDNILNQNQFDWRRASSSQQSFQVAGDLAGRMVDVSRNSVHNCSFGHQSHSNLKQEIFQPPNHVFHHRGVGPADSSVPIHRQMSQPSTPSPFITPTDRSSRHSLSSASGRSFLNNTMMPENLLQDDMAVDSKSLSPHVHLHQTPPHMFDPSTPPQLPSLEKHSSESFQQSHFSTAPSNDFNYIQMQEKMSINLNLGTSIDKTGQQTPFSTMDSAEGNQLYDTAKTHWYSFDSNKMMYSDIQSSPRLQESRTKRAVSADSSKPSYSDIAKTPRNGPVKIDKNVEGSVRNVNVKAIKRDEKPLQPLVKRASPGSGFWQRGSQMGETDLPRVAPTSRYGLDNFDDQLLGSGSHSIASENLANVISNRKSDSDVSGSIDTIGDIATQGITDHILSDNCVFDSGHSGSGSTHKQPFLSPNSAKPHLSSKPASKESLFFDPRRIFQCKSTQKNQSQSSASYKSKGATGTNLDDFGSAPIGDTILNNGKPTVSTTTSKLSSSARQHDYINNDLRDGIKLTNQTAAESGHGINVGTTEDQHKQKESRAGKKCGGWANGMHLRNKRSTSDADKVVKETHYDGSDLQQEGPGLWPDMDREKIEEWCSLMWGKVSHWGNLFVTSLLNLLIYVLGIIICFGSVAIHLLALLIGKSWTLIKEKLIRGYFDTKKRSAWSPHDHLRRHVGLEENISLPATGDEAMKRLLACKGKDPYSILGLRADSTDEDIKKYYRKQAVLVHPDKNQELGAEEAFKVLGHAFEMIGEPAKRKQYDSHAQEINEAEAMREFAEMLSKLQTKIQEAANIMHCDNCNGKHRRVPVERPFYSARFCQRCNTRHSAKEGDVWAESTMLGFYWHYFALMGGHVYNITEWMKCHKEYFSHMSANSHAVQYKIATEGNRRNKHHQQGEPNLEDLINRLFKAGVPSDGQRPPWGTSHAGTENSQGGTSAASTTATAAAAKKNRRKKKHH